MVVQPFVGLVSALFIMFCICAVGVLGWSNSDLINPNRSAAEARSMKMQADLAYQRGEFDFQLYKQQAENQQLLEQQRAQADEQLRQQRQRVELQVYMDEQRSRQEREFWVSIALALGGGAGMVLLMGALAVALIRFAFNRQAPVAQAGAAPGFPHQRAPEPPPQPQPQPQQPRQPISPIEPVQPVAPVARVAPIDDPVWRERVRQARQREVMRRQAVYGQPGSVPLKARANGNGNGHNRHNDEVVVKH